MLMLLKAKERGSMVMADANMIKATAMLEHCHLEDCLLQEDEEMPMALPLLLELIWLMQLRDAILLTCLTICVMGSFYCAKGLVSFRRNNSNF